MHRSGLELASQPEPQNIFASTNLIFTALPGLTRQSHRTLIVKLFGKCI